MIEGLSAEPPRREVAMELDATFKNMVRRRIEEEEEEEQVPGEEADGGGDMENDVLVNKVVKDGRYV